MKSSNIVAVIVISVIALFIILIIIDFINASILENTGIIATKEMMTTTKIDDDGDITTDRDYIVVIRDSEGESFRFDNEKLYMECREGEKIHFKYKKGKISNYLISWKFD
jgi:hypothetical protein